MKEYYSLNKDKMKEKYSKEITCECGSILAHNNMFRHLKTQKHQNYLSLLPNLEAEGS